MTTVERGQPLLASQLPWLLLCLVGFWADFLQIPHRIKWKQNGATKALVSASESAPVASDLYVMIGESTFNVVSEES